MYIIWLDEWRGGLNGRYIDFWTQTPYVTIYIKKLLLRAWVIFVSFSCLFVKLS